MPSVYALKPKFQALLRPIANRLAAIGATANQVTVATCAISIALGLDLTYGSRQWWMLPVWLFLRMAANAIDGMMAREHNQATRLGALLNELTDVLADAALLLPFGYLPNWNAALVGTVIVLAGLTEMTSVVGQTLTGVRRNDGPLGKSDRALLQGILGTWLALGREPSEWLQPAMIVLLIATIYNRARHILHISDQPQ
jgi:CDP-diacylglycerol--glycerol-3-phosphate 3-phosphatidyltransferase